MSYAGPDARTRDGKATVRPDADTPTARASAGRAGARAGRSRPPVSTQPAMVPHEATDGTDWRQLTLFGAGLLLGVAVGAGAALLTAPRTGAETRAVIASSVGRARRTTRRRGRDAWDDLRDELMNAKRMLRRRKARRSPEAESEL